MQIGLLEDDIAIQEMLRLILQDEGYNLVIYPTAEECLCALLVEQPGSPIDLLIVDLRLPRAVLGTEVIRQLRQHSLFRSLPIILTTASTFNDIEDLRGLQVTLLEKPFDIDDVLKIIIGLTSLSSSPINSSFP